MCFLVMLVLGHSSDMLCLESRRSCRASRTHVLPKVAHSRDVLFVVVLDMASRIVRNWKMRTGDRWRHIMVGMMVATELLMSACYSLYL